VSESIETRVMEAVARSQSIEPARVTPATTFEELDMSSLDSLALINELEEQFNVAIPNDEAMGLRSVGEAIDCIRRLAT